MKNRLYFLWDYDLSEADVRRLLRGGSETEKLWLTARILEHASFSDVFSYLTVKDIVSRFSHLRMRPVMKKAWQRALNVWGYRV